MAKKGKKKKSSKKASVKKSKKSIKRTKIPPKKSFLQRKAESKEELRQYTRFKPLTNTCAAIDTNTHSERFETRFLGLVLNQSPGGCSLIITQNDELKLKSKFNFKIDHEEPITSEVVWRVDLDPEVAKIGVRFIDS